METPEDKAAREENEKIRAEVVAEMKAEESGTAPVVDDASAKPKEEPEKTDPWEGVSPALKQAFDSMSARMETLQATETRLKQAESRIGAITNELYTAKKAAETVKTAPTAEQMAAAAASDEKWESLKKDFPEWAEAFDGRFDKKLDATVSALKAEIEALKTKGPGEGKSEADIAGAVEQRLLSFFKPKWKETIKTKEWQEWLAVQPAEKQALVQSESAADALELLDSFEEATQNQKTATEIAAERKRRLKTGDIPQGGKSTPVKSEADMTASELRANIGKEIFAET